MWLIGAVVCLLAANRGSSCLLLVLSPSRVRSTIAKTGLKNIVSLGSFVNNREDTASYGNLLQSAKKLCTDIVMSQKENGGYASLRKLCVDWTLPSMHYLISFGMFILKGQFLVW